VGRILPEYRINSASNRLVPCVLFAATMLGLGGCMSSPADQLAQIQTTANANPTTLVELAAQQRAKNAAPSEIEQQAQADVESLETVTANNVDQTQADQQGLLTQPKNIAATRSSIFSTQGSQFIDQGATQKTARLGNQPVDVTKSSIYSNNSVEAVIAADAAATDQATDPAAAMPSYDSLAERMAVPMPNSDEVEEVQKVAMGDTEIPILDANATLTANALLQPDKTVTQEVASADLAAVQAELTTNTLPATRKTADKKPLTLADLFRKSNSDDFDGDRFGKKKKVVTRGIPNMQTAALSDDTLPGVNTNAMFPTTTSGDDEDHDEDDQPEGLMQLASLPSMTRVAPNGLYLQTDKVDVACLRPELVSMIRLVEDHYKRPAIITSGFRDPRRNRRAGGVRHSLHTMCAAADIQVQGVSKWQLADFLRSIPGRGGVGTYCHTESVHIDIGGERDWNWRCRRKKRMRG
jgi:uncharacterized protein YcbK (DUF882 family)